MPLENFGKIKNITRKNDKIKIEFSSWNSLIVNEESFTEDYYYVGKEITKKEYDKLVDSLNDEKFLNYSINLCSKRLYTKKEIINKLKLKGAEKRAIKRIVEKLEQYSLINDLDYIKEYKQFHESKGEGKEKILNSLREKGISETLLKTLVFSYEKELEKAKKIVADIAKKHLLKPILKQKEAIISTLIRRGFSYDIAILSYESLSIETNKNDELKKCQKTYESLKLRGVDENNIIKKLLFKGFKYEDIKKVLGKE